MKLSAIVITKNEEMNISDCLRSLSWADELFVVDSGSTDATCSLAKKNGAEVIFHPFEDFASQRNFAMQKATGDWVLFIDADERVTTELAEEIKAVLKGSDPLTASEGLTPLSVYAIPRQTYFFGKRLRFGDARDDAPIRLFPRQYVTWTQPVHEKVKTSLPYRKLRNLILHYSTRSYEHYKKKFPNYLPRELATMRDRGVHPSLLDCAIRPPAKFFFLYFWKLGILDGIAGFQYAILSAYFYVFQKYWLYWKQRPFK